MPANTIKMIDNAEARLLAPVQVTQKAGNCSNSSPTDQGVPAGLCESMFLRSCLHYLSTIANHKLARVQWVTASGKGVWPVGCGQYNRRPAAVHQLKPSVLMSVKILSWHMRCKSSRPAWTVAHDGRSLSRRFFRHPSSRLGCGLIDAANEEDIGLSNISR